MEKNLLEASNLAEAGNLVEASNLMVSFGSHKVFKELNFKIKPHEHIALLGPNGCGKSTLLKLIAGEMRLSQIALGKAADNGKILWNFGEGKEDSALVAKEKIRLISPELQSEYTRQGWKSTGKEIILSGFYNTPLLYAQADDEEKKEVYELAQKTGLEKLLSMQAPSMSQGQMRAVLIMRALVSKPPLLLLDEPFEGLDAQSCESLEKLIIEAAQRGSTLVLTTHRPEDLPDIIKEIFTISKGKIQKLGKAEKTQAKPLTLAEEEIEKVLRLHKKRSKELIPEGKAFMELFKVEVYIQRKLVLKNINWEAKEGESWLITGANGSGKSTLMRLLHGEEFVAFGGSIKWFGQNTTAIPELVRSIGYVSDHLQHCYSYDITAKEIVLSGFDSSIGLYREMSSDEKRRARVWSKFLKLCDFENQKFRSLSTGQARRALLARALSCAPPVLLLDEPFSGLDLESRELWLNILPLLKSYGTHLILCSHHDEALPGVFSHELHMHKGEISQAGPLVF